MPMTSPVPPAPSCDGKDCAITAYRPAMAALAKKPPQAAMIVSCPSVLGQLPKTEIATALHSMAAATSPRTP